VTVVDAVALQPPKHETLVCVPDNVKPPPVVGMVTVAVAVPQVAVTVTVYVPGHNPVAVEEVCIGMVFHEYVNGPVPDVTVTVAVPLQAEHVEGVNVVAKTMEEEGVQTVHVSL